MTYDAFYAGFSKNCTSPQGDGRDKAMSVYKRGGVWCYKFRFAGQMIRESSKSESKTVAKDAERARRRELEESWNQIKRRKLPPLFSIAAAEWLKTRTGIASSTERSYKLAISHLEKDFGKRLLCDIWARTWPGIRRPPSAKV